MSEYKFWVVKNGQLHLFRNPHENFEPDSSEIEWGELLDIHFHDDQKTTWKDYEEGEEEEEADDEADICSTCGKRTETELDEDKCGPGCDEYENGLLETREYPTSTEESTKNIKGNRKIVRIDYHCDGFFKLPDGLDLEDNTVVEDWGVKWNTLYIHYVDGRTEEIDPVYDIEPDWKYPDNCEIDDAEPWSIDYSEDEEEEKEDEK